MFLVLDRDRDTVTAEIALYTEDVLATVWSPWEGASQIQMYIAGHIPLFSWVIASRYPLVQLFVMFLNTSGTHLEDLPDLGPHVWKPDEMSHSQHHGLNSVMR